MHEPEIQAIVATSPPNICAHLQPPPARVAVEAHVHVVLQRHAEAVHEGRAGRDGVAVPRLGLLLLGNLHHAQQVRQGGWVWVWPWRALPAAPAREMQAVGPFPSCCPATTLATAGVCVPHHTVRAHTGQVVPSTKGVRVCTRRDVARGGAAVVLSTAQPRGCRCSPNPLLACHTGRNPPRQPPFPPEPVLSSGVRVKREKPCEASGNHGNAGACTLVRGVLVAPLALPAPRSPVLGSSPPSVNLPHGRGPRPTRDPWVGPCAPITCGYTPPAPPTGPRRLRAAHLNALRLELLPNALLLRLLLRRVLGGAEAAAALLVHLGAWRHAVWGMDKDNSKGVHH